jgi:hypothetical protein
LIFLEIFPAGAQREELGVVDPVGPGDAECRLGPGARGCGRSTRIIVLTIVWGSGAPATSVTAAIFSALS